MMNKFSILYKILKSYVLIGIRVDQLNFAIFLDQIFEKTGYISSLIVRGGFD